METRSAVARRLRVARGGAAAAVATTIAATAHTLSGGTAPAPWLLVAVTALAWPLAVLLIGRRTSVLRTALAVTAAQALLHGAFSLVGDASPAAAVAHVHVDVHVHVHGRVALVPLETADTTMTGGHLLAAALTVVLIHTGERMLRAIAAGIRSALPSPATLAPFPSPAPRLAPAGAPRPIGRLVLSDLSRRGPPR